MFALARYVVRHKVGATAVVALGVFFLSPSGDDQEESNSPWAAQSAPSQSVTAEEQGFVGEMVDSAVDLLDEYGFNPVTAADETVGRFEDTADAYERVNSGR